jgi:ACS family hexuronate transporter-like MFS transporter
LIWVLFWLPIYSPPDNNPHVSTQELSLIQSDPHEKHTPVKWVSLLGYRQTWAFSIAKLLTDPIWWFWLFWAAPFFHEHFGVDLKHIGLPLIIIYNLASVGSVGGGWIPTGFARAGWSPNASRKFAMLICALCVLPVMATPSVNNKWIAIALIGVAAAAHQGFSANLFALSGDLFPKRAVGSVVGLGGMCGALAGMVFQSAAGRIVERAGYLPLFIIAGSAYMLAIGIIQALSPRLRSADLE